MADKKPSWGQKAQDQHQQRPDPSEFIFGKGGTGEAAPSPAPAPGGGQSQPTPDRPDDAEPLVRITVDVRKSIHKQLQRVCNERDLKLAPFIRQLIERELTKLQKPQ